MYLLAKNQVAKNTWVSQKLNNIVNNGMIDL